MNNKICYEIAKIESLDLLDVHLLALVTDTSYEVVFYAKYNDFLLQSNQLSEYRIVPFRFVDDIYANIAHIIRDDMNYDKRKLNVVYATNQNVTFQYENKNCNVYQLKKKWNESMD